MLRQSHEGGDSSSNNAWKRKNQDEEGVQDPLSEHTRKRGKWVDYCFLNDLWEDEMNAAQAMLGGGDPKTLKEVKNCHDTTDRGLTRLESTVVPGVELRIVC